MERLGLDDNKMMHQSVRSQYRGMFEMGPIDMMTIDENNLPKLMNKGKISAPKRGHRNSMEIPTKTLAQPSLET